MTQGAVEANALERFLADFSRWVIPGHANLIRSARSIRVGMDELRCELGRTEVSGDLATALNRAGFAGGANS